MTIPRQAGSSTAAGAARAAVRPFVPRGPERQHDGRRALRRRRDAALRLEPVHDGRRDPDDERRTRGPLHYLELTAWTQAVAHLRAFGLEPVVPRPVAAALAGGAR